MSRLIGILAVLGLVTFGLPQGTFAQEEGAEPPDVSAPSGEGEEEAGAAEGEAEEGTEQPETETEPETEPE